MTDIWMKGRVRGLHRETFADEDRPPDAPPGVAGAEPPGQPGGPAGPGGPGGFGAQAGLGGPGSAGPAGGDVHQALQMLTLAQRTAEEHVTTAHRQADKIQADARAAAEQIVRDAQGRADGIRREADKALSDARTRAAQIAKDAEVQAGNARRAGDKIVSDARTQASDIAKDAQASADGLKRLAEQRYEEMVGNLAAKREALQQQIEALQEFDRDYRGRLLAFMQAQLRALWVDEPQVDGDIEPSQTPPPPRQPAAGSPTAVPAQAARPTTPGGAEAG